MSRVELGFAGHFCAWRNCAFRRCTHVHGKYRVSTVGAYYPGPDHDEMETVGVDRFFETMVFELGADGEPLSFESVDFAAYNDADAAQAGHEAMVAKYLAEVSDAG